MATHEVTNQVPLLVGYDVADDPALDAALVRGGAGWARDDLHELGRLAGSERVQTMGRVANEHPPALRSHDRFGHRIDEVEFHPYWHELMAAAVSHGLHAAAWRDASPGAHVARAAKFYVWAQAELGHLCPISMTYAAVPALRHEPELARRFEPLLASGTYDYGLRPPATKAGLIAGMSMTEKQGGSDVRTNSTVATAAGDGTWTLVGHKWFTSAPMSDLFLTLAQSPAGLSCFLVPRVCTDGSRNPIRLQRLKDKLGNRSNASAEIEYEGALGWLVGEEGHGVRTIMEMVTSTRLDSLLGSAAIMRAGAVQAVHHAAHRRAFGRSLIDQPLMANVLADLVVEAEAALVLGLRLAAATERAAAGDGAEAALRRLVLPAAKYWCTKRAPGHAAEALECLGGNGYVEEAPLARLYREAPVNSVWEGSGNVAALDARKAVATQPGSLEVYFAEVAAARGADARLDEAADRLRRDLADPDDAELRARRMAELLALVFQGALLVQAGHAAVSDAFCASRLGGDWGGAYGTLPPHLDLGAVVARALPATEVSLADRAGSSAGRRPSQWR